MDKQSWSRLGLVVGMLLIAAFFSIPSHYFGDNGLGQQAAKHKITLGLDLAGGTELDYKIDLSDAIAQNNDDDPQNDVNLENIAESVRDALEKRVNPAGVGEIIVKRSQVDDEQHILIQMPPSSNVVQAKKDAEQDNRLEFYEENPELEKNKKEEIGKILEKLQGGADWDETVKELKANDSEVVTQVFESRWADNIHDPKIAEKITSAKAGTIINEVLDTQTEMEYTMGEDGNLVVNSMPKALLAIIKVTQNELKSREKKLPEEAEARHILFAYPEATRAGEDVRYKSAEEAKTEAEKILQQLQTDGTDNFAELAKNYSTEPGADKSGGNLGKFTADKMVKEFSDAVFEKENIGLIDHVIESEFGFHVIEVLGKTEARTETTEDREVAYEILGWDKSNMRWVKTELGGRQLENATVGFDKVGSALVNLLFNTEGGDLFAEITGRVASKKCDGNPCRLGIKVGGKWITQPTVRQKIIGRQSQISGNFTFESAKELADGLNLGAIDAPVKLSGQLTIEPSLGQDQLNKSLKAAAFGLIATMLFMILMYNFAGFVAAISLAMYAGLYIAILKLWPESFGGPIVLSLSGIAGMALSNCQSNR
jgi:protein-export membrane protein SecD